MFQYTFFVGKGIGPQHTYTLDRCIFTTPPPNILILSGSPQEISEINTAVYVMIAEIIYTYKSLSILLHFISELSTIIV